MIAIYGTGRELDLAHGPRHAPAPASQTEPARRVTAVATIRRAGMFTKHARGKFSPTDIPRENSMPVTKRLTSARSRTELSLSHRINQSALSGQRARLDGAPRPSTRQGPSLRPRLAERVRSMCAGLMPLVGHAGALPSLIVVIASWLAAEALAGCAAYARAMYPALAMDDLTEPVDLKPLAAKPLALVSSEPGLPKNQRPGIASIARHGVRRE